MTVYSFSTVLMAVLASNLLLALVVLCLCNTKLMINIGCKILLFLVIFTALRFMFPFEIPHAITVVLPTFLSEPLVQFQHVGFSVSNIYFSFWNIVEVIWLIGALIGLIYFIFLCIRTERNIILYQKVLTKQEPYFSMLNRICSERHKRNRFQIIELPGLTTPMLYGIFRPRILIPENFRASEQELYCYLSHEAAHHFHHDLLLKVLVKLITIIYWWNPFCLLLNSQADMVLEMRVDHSLTKSSSDDTIVYTRCLLDMANKVISHKQIPKILSMSFITRKPKKEMGNVEKRVQMLLANQEKRNFSVNLLVFSSVAAIYLLSYAFIFEAYYTPYNVSTVASYGFVSSENSYAILNEDGTYDIYCYGLRCETLNSLSRFPDNFPVYTANDLSGDAPFEQPPPGQQPIISGFPSFTRIFSTPSGAPPKRISPNP